MPLYTLEELHEKTAWHISSLISNGFKIDVKESVSNKKNIFNIVLKKTDFTVEIHTSENSDSFTRLFIVTNKKDHRYDTRFCCPYYKVRDNIYADSEDEAKEERRKWYAKCLSVDPESSNPIQAFADKLGEYITNCFKEGDK